MEVFVLKKKKAVIIITALSVVLTALGAFAVYQNRKLVFSERVNEIYGERALNELTESLDSMDEALKKSLYATSAPLISRLYTDAATYAASAVTALGGLPYSTYEMEKTSRFINGAGDFVLYLSRAASEGELPDAATMDNVVALSETLRTAAEGFTRVRQALADHALTMDAYGSCADDGAENTVGCELQLIEEQMPDYPELIYDGHFSALEDDGAEADEITEEKAKRAAAIFLGVPEQRLSLAGRSDGELPCAYFSLSGPEGEEQQIAVCLCGGEIAEWTSSRRPDSGNVTEDDAAQRAAAFLAEHGYGDLTELSRDTDGGICTVSFANSAGGVTSLNGVVCVSVALDNGEVCAMTAEEYLKNREETGTTPAISPDAALTAVPESLKPISSRLVLTQVSGIKEFLCYEITCESREGEEVIVFVDAQTGQQKMIELTETI
ncbi:MAG: hypothetical protein EOM54_05500 [Clostridia bacterium]|nr:hypothetical protein [Clostridia bacterium]NCC67920.1 hypothetical protein [Clostridia bacterium]